HRIGLGLKRHLAAAARDAVGGGVDLDIAEAVDARFFMHCSPPGTGASGRDSSGKRGKPEKPASLALPSPCARHSLMLWRVAWWKLGLRRTGAPHGARHAHRIRQADHPRSG